MGLGAPDRGHHPVLRGLLDLTRSEWGRWVGLASASVNSIIQLMVLPAAPFSALALFSVDILIIYGLAAYGGRQAA